MKLRDIVNVAKNKRNNQINLSLKKREMKGIGISTEKLLDMNLNIKPDVNLDIKSNKLLFQ